MAGSGKIHGKQIKDNSLAIQKLSNGVKLLPSDSLLGINKISSEFTNDNEFVNKRYIDESISSIVYLDNIVEDITPELGGELNTAGFNIVSNSGDLLIENISYPKTDGSNNQVMTTDGNGNLSFQTTFDPFYMQFVLSETVNNTNEYFFSWRSRSNNSSDGFKSNRDNGLNQPCSPIMIPYDVVLKSATLVIKTVGVNNSNVVFPVLYKTNLYTVGFNNSQDPSINSGNPYDIDFNITSGTIGTFSGADIEQTIILDNVNINLDRGQMIGLEFETGTGASEIAITQMAFVSFVCERR